MKIHINTISVSFLWQPKDKFKTAELEFYYLRLCSCTFRWMMFSVWSFLRSEISRYASLNFISVSANSFLKCWITSVNFFISASFACSSLFKWISGPSCCKEMLKENSHRLKFQDFDNKIPLKVALNCLNTPS